MEQVFGPSENLDEAKKRSGVVLKARSNIDVEFINPFLHATKKTLEVQANTPLKLLKPFLKKTPAKDVAIAGVISLISDKFNGSITLCFPAGVFLKIYENMFGEKHTAITKELEDAAGELLNIIYGQAKIELNAKAGYDLKKALPTVLTGEKINISQQGRVPTVVLPFETDAGVFHIEIESEKH
jgi:chemotaxis protein CheX